jgi:putative FmdB family regulatory protein
MPLFEYTCQDCGSRFEKLVRKTGDEVACPSCGTARVARELSTFAAHANGRSKDSAPALPCGNACPTPGMCGMKM